jgi:hypothetical protein
MKKLLITILTVFSFTVFAGDLMPSGHNWNIGSTNQALYDAALAEAKAEQKKAAAVGFEWRDIGKFMKSAKKAMDAGDWSKAKKLLDTAASQGRLGQQQAIDQADAGPISF